MTADKYGMTGLEAICIGYAVPRCDFEAEVHSVFTSAANLRLVRSKRLVTMVVAEEADLPQGIRLNTPHGFSFEGLQTKERVTVREGILCCEHSNLQVDLRMAQRWKCSLPALAANLSDPATSSAWQFVKQMLDERRARARSGLPAGQLAATRRISENAKSLVAATSRYNLTEAVGVVTTLIGLGPGLTPAGDDFLVGYLTGLWCTAGENSEQIRFLSGLGKAVFLLSRRTNTISQTYLIHAARGQVSSRLDDLAKTICQGERSDRLVEAGKAAIQIGHDSGMEAVTGLLMGLSAWEDENLVRKLSTEVKLWGERGSNPHGVTTGGF
jgi:hypothetical protein